ncbi:MAG TPA: hypothetical protein VFD17_05970 [Clostridia bacterium]|nr:hypothetical protein [Clostridia bacterium]
MNMDTIKFEQEIIKYDNESQKLLCAKVIINGILLMETVRAYELPYAKKYDQESIAGGYMYNFAEYL